MDRIIEVRVDGSHIRKDNRYAGVQHEGNTTRLRITFDESWDGYAKKVTWWDARGENPVEILLGADKLEDVTRSTRVYLCYIPPEPLAESGECTLVIDGYTDGRRQRSAADRLVVREAPYEEEAGESTDPTPTQAEQLQEEIDSILGTIAQASTAAEDAANSAQEAAHSAQAAAESLGAIGDAEANAAASAAAAQASAQAAEETAARVDPDQITQQIANKGDSLEVDGTDGKLWLTSNGKRVGQGVEVASHDSIPTSEKGAAGGVATLDENQKVPASQLPDTDIDSVDGLQEALDGKQDANPILSKDNLLKDSTAALYGLNTSAVPNDVFAWIGKYNLNWWRRRFITGRIHYVEKRTPADDSIVIQGRSGLVYVSKTISFDTEAGGDIALENPETLELSWLSETAGITAVSEVTDKAPCYVRFGDNEAATPIYYLPEGATTTEYSGDGTLTVRCTSSYREVHINKSGAVVMGSVVSIEPEEIKASGWEEKITYPFSTKSAEISSYTCKIYLSKSISIGAAGKISLESPETMDGNDYGSLSSAATAANLILQKAPVYMQVSRSSPHSATGTVYYIPANADYNENSAQGGTIDTGSYEDDDGDDYYTLWLNPSATAPAGVVTSEYVTYDTPPWNYVYSSSRNAYPDNGEQDGYEYEYLGIPFENFLVPTRVAHGSYEGMGQYGEENPNTLTFDFEPAMVLIMPEEAVISSEYKGSNTMIYLRGKAADRVGNSSGEYWRYYSSSGGTLSWYAIGDAEKQMNTASKTYYYVAVG